MIDMRWRKWCKMSAPNRVHIVDHALNHAGKRPQDIRIITWWKTVNLWPKSDIASSGYDDVGESEAHEVGDDRIAAHRFNGKAEGKYAEEWFGTDEPFGNKGSHCRWEQLVWIELFDRPPDRRGRSANTLGRA